MKNKYINMMTIPQKRHGTRTSEQHGSETAEVMLQMRPVGDELGPCWTRLCFEHLLFFHAFAPVVASGWNAPPPLGPGPTYSSQLLPLIL